MSAAATALKRWDPLVRLTHWGVALAVVLNGFLLDEGSLLHVWVGYTALGLLLLRLFWGLVGAEPARFSSFPPSLSAAWAHVVDLVAGRHRRYRSHNPLGTLMVYALWATLLVVAASGLAMEGTLFPGAETIESRQVEIEHDQEDEGDEILEEIHETAANLLLVLAGLHVAGVGLESWRSGTNLAKAMVTGRRNEPGSRAG